MGIDQDITEGLLDRFDSDEIDVLRLIFNELSSKLQPHDLVDGVTFLQYFSLPGLWGERLYEYFASKNTTGGIDYGEFCRGIATICRGGRNETIGVLFQMMDLNGDSLIESSDLASFFSNIHPELLNIYLGDLKDFVSGAQMITGVKVTAKKKDDEQDVYHILTSSGYHETGKGFKAVSNSGMPGENQGDVSQSVVSVTCDKTAAAEDEMNNVDSSGDAPRAMPFIAADLSTDLGLAVTKSAKVHVADVMDKFAGNSTGGKMTLSDFRVWVDKHSGFIQFLRSAMHEEYWGLRGNALYRKNAKRSPNKGPKQVKEGSNVVAKTTKPLNMFRYLLLADFFGVTGKAEIDSAVINCPDCKAALLFCRMCFQPGLNLFMHKDTGDPVIVCTLCRDQLAITSCWICNWDFSRSQEVMDRQRKCQMEGYIYKLGRYTRRWVKRYYVLTGNMLYYYKGESDIKPIGMTFLEGSFVYLLNTAPERKANQSVQTTRRSRIMEPMSHRGHATEKFGFCITYRHTNGQQNVQEIFCVKKEERDVWLRGCSLGARQRVIDKLYQFHEKVGTGRFSLVFRATHIASGRQVAIKVIHKNETTPIDRLLLRTELRITAVLHHDNIIKIIETFDSETNLCIVMQYVEGGELYQLLQQRHSLPEIEVQSIISELVATVAYLHTCGVAHRDLKPENILMTVPDSTGKVSIRVSDFGLSAIAGPKSLMMQPCGTLPYVAPEVLVGKGYTKSCDLWSVGVITFLLLRGRLPFNPQKGVFNSQVYKVKFEGHQWLSISDSAKHFIRGLLQKDVTKRMSIEQTVNHVWIKNPTAAIPDVYARKTPTHLALLPEYVDQEGGTDMPV